MSGHLELDSTQLEQVAINRNWSEQQTHNAKRIIDGGMGTNYGFKDYQEVSFGRPGEGDMDGYGWVYHIYNERVDELESII